MFDSFLSWLGTVGHNVAIPFEMHTFFKSINAIWDALPLAIRLCFASLFSIMCFFVVLKMIV